VRDCQPYQTPQSCALVIFVIFGVTGDLTRRLVIPSLYNLAEVELLPEKFCIVGVARRSMSNDARRGSPHEFATRPVDDKIANRLLEYVTYDHSRSRHFSTIRIVL
jgi:glucose-6-phosphate 1-dehydrogenase